MADKETLSKYLRKVTADLRGAQARLAEVERRDREPVAIIGMSCRYPGGVRSPQGLWRLVAEGVDGISEFPADRGWDLERLSHPDRDRVGTSHAAEGGFLPEIERFDADFFEISPREAVAMEPQHRFLLEATWEAFEDAGIDPARLRGSQTGAFMGISSTDYGLNPELDAELEGYIGIGKSPCVASGRVSYSLGLEGPAMTVDTACSSSLVTLHLATQALRREECSLAVAGGATIRATAKMFTEFSRQRVVAPDGRCKAFAEAANGVGWSEGVGMLVLERLSDAERNGHPVLAVVRGSAVNQDGASNGLTAPNGPSQERVIRQALANAQLQPKDVDAVEAHGTGTALGDPIEAGALLATYGQGRERPLKLGSVKSNIAHTEAAAGVAGVIKMVMAMREGVLPKTLHVDAPSSEIDWEAGKVELLTEAEPWESNDHPRRAAVSSFGVSGTNAHVILEQAPAPVEEDSEDGVEDPGLEGAERPLPGAIPLLISAKTEPALRAKAAELATHLRQSPELDPVDVAYSLAKTRGSFEYRAAAVGTEREQLLTALSALAAGDEGAGIARGLAPSDSRPVFLFPGQGSQWAAMAKGLLETSPVFASEMERCEEALAPHVDFSVRDVLAGAEGAASIERIEVVQPALFAITVCLASLWRQCGVHPAAVAGHSQGEIAAAHIAGGLSLEDASMLAAVRSRLIAKLAGKGAMVSVALPATELEGRIERWGGRVEVAAINGPSATTLAADRASIPELLEQCAAEDVRAREVPATIASHSVHVEELREEVLEALAPISPRSAEIPFHSTVTGEVLDTASLDASYWYRNLRQTVLLEPVVRSMLAAGRRSFIEISPHPVLSFGVQETIDSAPEATGAAITATLRREQGSPERFALSLAEAHTAGAEVDWEAFFAASGAKTVPLPTYPFQRRRYWLNAGAGGADAGSIGLQDPEHPLLGATLEDPRGEGLTLTGRLSLQTHPWLKDHAVAETVLLPGTGFLELAMRAARQAGCETIEELTLEAPLILPERGAVAVQVRVEAPDGEGRREVSIHSRPATATEGEEDKGWSCNASGALSPEAPVLPEPLAAWPPDRAQPLAVDSFYERLAESGFEYGPAFQGLTAAWALDGQVFAEVSLDRERGAEAGRFGMHPALLDAALHGAMLEADGSLKEPKLPFSWSGVRLPAAGPQQLRVLLDSEGESLSLRLFDQDGAPVGAVGKLAIRAVDPAQFRTAAGLHEIEWAEVALGEQAGSGEGEDSEIARCDVASDAAAPAAARAAAEAALAAIQEWLGAERAPGSRLALVTRGAVATGDEESPDPAAAAVWGLVRSAQSEHPGSFVLIDSDGSEASEAAISAALAGEDAQIALREGIAMAPRAVSLSSGGDPGSTFDPQRTVLISGGTGGLGATVARHLVTEHGCRRLLLVSRSGAEAAGADELVAELEQLGAEVELAACDVSDRARVEALLEGIPGEHPLGAVIHAAGAIDDATVEVLGPAQIEGVFAPKVNAAWHLHELTAEMGLSAFVMFSSATGVLGTPGQANYAAANAFLDALAQRRRADGLAAVSIGWGLWGGEEGMAAGLNEADLARIARAGFGALSREDGLARFDAALGADRPYALALPLERKALRARAAAGTLPPVLAGLVRLPARREAESGAFGAKLAALPEAERRAEALELVRTEVAAVLGHSSTDAVRPDRAFKELGFDSLAAVELRNRLVAATGLRLPATLVFDHPSSAKLGEFLLAEASAGGGTRRAAVRARATEEPVAIVGMACRYPGAVSSPAELWQLLAEGREGISEFPADRGWDLERLYHPDPDHAGTSYARVGGFLDAGDFDPEFFDIAPREALAMDPQHRLLMEASWEALEDAGIDPASLRGSETGVFAGVMTSDYGAGWQGAAGAGIEGYHVTGMSGSVASGRVAYSLGLEGPAMTVDTACSSSLVAMHLAAHALRGGECSLALAGGATVLASPIVFTEFSRQRGLAPDGRCKSFSERADGAGFSEGTGLLVLERLSDAERNGHRVLATIRGSAVNQDGASNGLTAPNGPSQERVIRQALANAGLAAGDVDAVEAHGTGTTLGDPIEAGALLATYGQERERPLKLGSIKSNIGHSQAAAGAAGVIKMVLAMREGVLPKTLHADAPSSKVDWEAGQVELLDEAEPWEPNGHPRRAGVSSFGISGTNAHLILEEAPSPVDLPSDDGNGADDPAVSSEPAALPGPVPLVLSAKSEPALRDQANRLAAHLRQHPKLDPTDVAYSLATSRGAFEHRAAAVGDSPEELLGILAGLGRGEAPAGLLSGTAVPDAKLAYLFSGQGSQRVGMGRGLYEAYPAYAEALDQACAEIDAHADRPLREILFAAPGSAEAELLDLTTYAQPALFATEVALYRLLESWGLRPDLLAGHSIGEIAAAHLAGVLSLAGAARLVTARGQLMGALPEGGAMVAIEASEDEMAAAIDGRERELAIAAVNSPSSLVVSGAGEAVADLQARWGEQGRRTKRLAVSHAFHSPLMEPMLEQFEAVANELDYAEPRIPIVSNLSGEPLAPELATDPAYWVAHVREPVRFAATVATLAELGAGAYLELGCGGALTAMAAESLEERDSSAVPVPALREGQAEAHSLTTALAQLHVAGAGPDWEAFFAGSGATAVRLPTYPFQRKRYWLSAAATAGDLGQAGLGDADHPLLGATVEGPGGEGLTLTGRVSLTTHPWLADHAVAGAALLPGTAFLELALRAGAGLGSETVEELTLQAPLALPEQGATRIQVFAGGAGEDGGREVSIHSRPDDEEGAWTCHARGILSGGTAAEAESLEAWPPAGAEPLELAGLYDRLADSGLDYGPAFRGLRAAWRQGDDLYAEVALAPEHGEEAGRFGLHPALLDSALHVIALADPDAGLEQALRLPFSWSEVSLSACGATELRVKVSPLGEDRISISLAGEDGAPLARIGSLDLRPFDPDQLPAAKRHGGLLGLEWQPLSLEGVEGAPAEVRELAPEPGRDLADAAARTAAAALDEVQRWLVSEAGEGSGRLAVVTRGAVATEEGEAPDPALASAWGLLRSAQSEHPGRFLLIDVDGSAASAEALPAALTNEEEPQLALRDGVALAPRAVALADQSEPGWPDPERTVLITGATGGLGALVARHVVAEHGARHLLLVSRRGAGAGGAESLRAELEELGAEVELVACDVSDRGQLESLIASIPATRPLGAVVHAAGVVADATVEGLGTGQIDEVFGPKAGAAWHLHELTAELDLSAFVLFSSAAGTLGSPGQANYAAANAFLDALAQRRRAEGLPASSIAWGLWERESAMTSELGQAGLERLRRGGIAALSDERGLVLFEEAIAAGRADVLALDLDRAGLAEQAAAGTLPPLLRGLVRAPARRAGSGLSLAAKLAASPPAEHEQLVLELVLAEVAVVLGHGSAEEIRPDRAFKELGFDSLAAVELRNRLQVATGMRLKATEIFDHPSPAAMARHLLAEAAAGGAERVAVRARPTDEPVAIVGMACRYPGGVNSPQELWELLSTATDAISPFPADRGWDLEGLYDPDPDHPGTTYARHGGFLDDVAGFDAGFFSISPREALTTDPQQRLLLEASWEALEDAGIDPAALRGAPAGVFAGVMSTDYGDAAQGAAPGMTSSVISGRVSYTLGLEGPAISLDTACSSSLVAMHLAAQALRGGECDLALAGGVTVLATPSPLVFFSSQRGLAPDGRCKSFSEGADGVGWSEGVGMLTLERLSDAERNGHTVLATIRGTAVNQDGASNGLTAPNGPSQERVIRQALANAGLAPGEVDAVEAHGTGTTLGDPIEAGALLATYGQDREQPLKLGSLKSNIGHTQAAAGAAGVIKMVLAMREGVLPKTLHVDAPSSKVDWEAGQVELLDEAEPWEPNGHPRRAGVSSFGISGTNAHVILEEAPSTVAMPRDDGEEVGDPAAPSDPAALPYPPPLVLSAKTEPALQEAAARLSTHLRQRPELDPTDVAYSLATARGAFEHRAAVVGAEREELLAGLGALAEGSDAPGLARGIARTSQSPVFLFGGQGSQHAQMALQLLDSSPSFARHIEECEKALAPHVDWSLQEVLRDKDATWLDRLDIVQPALFAVMVSLARLWSEAGVTPSAVVGHSQGEIAAAHIAGGLSLEDAALVIALRAKAMTKLAGKGGMLSVSLPAKDAEALLQPFGKRLSLAAINGPASLVVSGEPEALKDLQATCERDGVRCQEIAVDYAAHSAQIEQLEAELLAAFAPISPRSGEVPFHSTVTGEVIDTVELDAGYWYRNLRQTVLMEPVLRSLLQAGRRSLIEISPHPVLAFGAQETIDSLPEAKGASVTATLRRDQGTPERFALSLAEAHTAGAEVDWQAFFAGSGAKAVPLPTYPFQRKRYWLNAASSADAGSIGQEDPEHPLLGATLEDPRGQGLTLTGRLSLQTHPWLKDHAVAETVLLPGTAFLELALRAARQAECETIEELTLEAPLVLPESGAVQIQVRVEAPDENGRREVSIHSKAEGQDQEAGEWALHAQGNLSQEIPEAPEPIGTWPPEGAEPIAIEGLYEDLAEAGFEYGPGFQNVRAAWRSGEHVYAEISLDRERGGEAERFGLHPALLDGAGHMVLHSAATDRDRSAPFMPPLPFSWRGVSFASSGASSLRVRIAFDDVRAGMLAVDETGAPVVSVASVRSRPVDPAMLRAAGRRLPLHRLDWVGLDLAQVAEVESPRLALVGDDAGDLAGECYPDLPALLEALAAGAPAPEVLVADFRAAAAGDEALPGAAHATALCGLELAQAFLAAEALRDCRLCLLTAGAVAVAEGESVALATAPLWGLLRSARSEHPGRFALLDSDEASGPALAAAIAAGAKEPQLALRGGRALVPRLARVTAAEEPLSASIDAERTVLITGGVSGIGAALARHLAAENDAAHLLLVSRSGREAKGAAELERDLLDLGAEVTIAACDVSDRAQLEEVLGSIPAAHPLGAVFHSAGVLDDGVLESLDAERLARVMRPKVDAAWHLHELTADAGLSAFALFSSAAGVVGGAAQASYAAANAFLDGLASHRRAAGLPATSLAWGFWAQVDNALADLGEAGADRFAQQVRERLGLAPMPPEQGLALLGTALTQPDAQLVPAAFDAAVLRSQAAAGMLPAVLRGLVRAPLARERQGASLAGRLAGLSDSDRQALTLDLVRGHVAAVLGHAVAADVDPGTAFRDLGFDSLAAVELRNRLVAATGLTLPATLVFDYPSATEVAAHLVTAADPGAEPTGDRDGEDAFRRELAQLPLATLRDAGLLAPLRELIHSGGEAAGTEADEALGQIDSMDLEDLIERTLEPRDEREIRAEQ